MDLTIPLLFSAQLLEFSFGKTFDDWRRYGWRRFIYRDVSNINVKLVIYFQGSRTSEECEDVICNVPLSFFILSIFCSYIDI